MRAAQSPNCRMVASRIKFVFRKIEPVSRLLSTGKSNPPECTCSFSCSSTEAIFASRIQSTGSPEISAVRELADQPDSLRHAAGQRAHRTSERAFGRVGRAPYHRARWRRAAAGVGRYGVRGLAGIFRRTDSLAFATIAVFGQTPLGARTPSVTLRCRAANKNEPL